MQIGIETLLNRHADWLRNGRVGLLSHQAAVTVGGATSAQRLRAALGDGLAALFGPEHGYFGQADAGAQLDGAVHPEWGIPVHSLYGAQRAPTPGMLAGLDRIVVDFQDLGARCYTYLATLRRMLEAAAAAGVPVIVADRPIPLPRVVDGPPLDPALRSFVADAPVPLAYGMTPGETALWLKAALGLALDLRIAACRGWRREAHRLPDAPEWLPPSPGIRTWESAQCYLATVFTEALPVCDCGRATNLAFRVLGAPWVDAPRLCAALARAALPGVAFHPHRYVAGAGTYAGQELDGVRLTVTAPHRFRPATTAVAMLDLLGRLHGGAALWRSAGYRPDFFDKLFGATALRQALEAGASWTEIVRSWKRPLACFRRRRAAALLYAPSGPRNGGRGATPP